MTKLYDGPDGRKWVETGEYTVEGAECEQGTVYLHSGKVLRVDRDGNSQWAGACPILRLATPEEIAGTEAAHGDLRKCPGCGVDQIRYHDIWLASSAHADACPWIRAWDERAVGLAYTRSAYADAHWKEFVKYEVGVAGRTITLPVDASGLVPIAFIIPAQPEILPTWTDGDVKAELAARTGVVHVDAAENRRRLVAVMAEDAKPREVYRPDAPDRRTSHVPVAKAWVNPAMLGR